MYLNIFFILHVVEPANTGIRKDSGSMWLDNLTEFSSYSSQNFLSPSTTTTTTTTPKTTTNTNCKNSNCWISDAPSVASKPHQKFTKRVHFKDLKWAHFWKKFSEWRLERVVAEHNALGKRRFALSPIERRVSRSEVDCAREALLSLLFSSP